MPKSKTIRELADEAGLDYDLALVTLWDAGYESLEDIDDTIPVRNMSGVCSTLGVVTAKKMQCLAYWVQAWEVTEQEARERLLKCGISVSPDARMLPKGALKN